MFRIFPTSTAYQILRSTSEDEADEEAKEDRLRSSHQAISFWKQTVVATTCLLLGFVLGIGLGTNIPRNSTAKNQLASFATGFPTDFQPANSAIGLTTVQFTGTAGFHDNGTAYVVDSPGPKYFDPPSPEVDAAWEELVGDRYFSITEDEAKEAWGENYLLYYDDPFYGYRAGLDVLHTLHCLNTVRKALHKDYYFANGTDALHHRFFEYHTGHCLDIIRQSIQCHADTTPIPLKFFKGIHTGFIDSNQVHTCRDFKRIREWAIETFAQRQATRIAKTGKSTPPPIPPPGNNNAT